jgi:hypothetical protein
LPDDAEAILALKLPARPCDDFIAWSQEANGMFSVRSAYRLGIELILSALSTGQSSSAPNGDRQVWNIIWKANVPQKLRIFAWKATTNSLAVRTNLNRRITYVDPVCAICGCGKEDIHHALVSCTLVVALRHGMRDWWNLPAESAFRDTGDE